jgi:hypothetical protein
MTVNRRVEEPLRKAYSAAIGKNSAEVAAALEGVSHEDSLRLVGLGLYVTGYIVNDINRDGITDDNLRKLAIEIIDGEADWMDLGNPDHVARFLKAAANGDLGEVNRLGAEDVTGLVIVAGAHLLAHYRQDGERWYRYLDAILDNYEATATK